MLSGTPPLFFSPMVGSSCSQFAIYWIGKSHPHTVLYYHHFYTDECCLTSLVFLIEIWISHKHLPIKCPWQYKYFQTHQSCHHVYVIVYVLSLSSLYVQYLSTFECHQYCRSYEACLREEWWWMGLYKHVSNTEVHYVHMEGQSFEEHVGFLISWLRCIMGKSHCIILFFINLDYDSFQVITFLS